MELPLTSQVYLLAYNTDKGKLTCGGYLGYILRAAALTELHHLGALSDADGKPHATGTKVTDPLLAEVLREIASAPKPKKWAWWVHHGQTPMFRAVQHRLVDDRIITTERYRVLGIFPATRVKIHEHRKVSQLRSTVTRTLNGSNADPREAALTALAASGQIRIAISQAQTRQHAKRLESLAIQAGPALPALRQVIRNHQESGAGG
ncbi:GOLPH3/VPS74 family protein [Allorhizocola rhizosphaerae]|uniref:GOLPH3/VPS74 family protein n=1 Tax=Allorhizocola rhizosphaerae TaxID=1872709 RepID=UPI000E3E55FA|nr:GPP34 family phosphoprotein [Allorhizocola rhizosphaerae]